MYLRINKNRGDDTGVGLYAEVPTLISSITCVITCGILLLVPFTESTKSYAFFGDAANGLYRK